MAGLGKCAEISAGKCLQAQEPISSCLGGERRARQKAKLGKFHRSAGPTTCLLRNQNT